MNNENLLPSNEYREYKSRLYSEPSLQAQMSDEFIEKLRETQGANTQEITEQTEALGTTMPSNLGGLTGAGSYFSSRYMTPQTNTLAQDLRTATRAAALNQALANEKAAWEKKQTEAYREYQRRMNDKQNALQNTPKYTVTEGGVEYEDTGTTSKTVANVEPSYSPMGSGTFEYSSGGGSVSLPQSSLPTSTPAVSLPTPSIMPSGPVDIQRDKFGNITSLTYNGKTYNGNDAKSMYDKLQKFGTIGGRI